MKKTLTIPMEIEIPEDICAVTVDENGLICGHVSIDDVAPVLKNQDGLRNEWLLLDGRPIGRIELYGRRGRVAILNWKSTLVKYEK